MSLIALSPVLKGCPQGLRAILLCGPLFKDHQATTKRPKHGHLVHMHGLLNNCCIIIVALQLIFTLFWTEKLQVVLSRAL